MTDQSSPKRLGTELTPKLETLIRLRPSHVLVSTSRMQKSLPLRPEQSLLALPFMKTADLRQSIVKLGDIFDRKAKAASFVEQLERVLVPTGIGSRKNPGYRRCLAARNTSALPRKSCIPSG